MVVSATGHYTTAAAARHRSQRDEDRFKTITDKMRVTHYLFARDLGASDETRDNIEDNRV
jgi:hypothetical protein